MKIGSSESWAVDARRLAVSIEWRYRREGSAALARRLKTGVAQKAQRTILTAAD